MSNFKVEITGSERLKNQLRTHGSWLRVSSGEVSVTVGFTQFYALYVHEINAPHKVGQWKFLETAAKRNRRNVALNIERALNQKASFQNALMIGGLLIQREAQLLTPVDTSALKASAFTCPTNEVEAVSETAYRRSEAIRKAAGK